ncbi:hypothetical protein [Clostridium uliginosum]|uniref:Uncharacterized protein n=1 Tax=Clostridium uliginosum TaxID=119641 RepID=A0A1I1I5V4_9CLOT|nr:hypothetical protein [Clostridium uliginosum]SFC29588.1 hypothetical protein SAMN05421842_10274 [Clostridium uliginosum]
MYNIMNGENTSILKIENITSDYILGNLYIITLLGNNYVLKLKTFTISVDKEYTELEAMDMCQKYNNAYMNILWDSRSDRLILLEDITDKDIVRLLNYRLEKLRDKRIERLNKSWGYVESDTTTISMLPNLSDIVEVLSKLIGENVPVGALEWTVGKKL